MAGAPLIWLNAWQWPAPEGAFASAWPAPQSREIYPRLGAIAHALIWIKPGEVGGRGSCLIIVHNGRKPMTLAKKAAIAACVLACATLFSFGWSEQGTLLLSVDNAQARVGHPATPMSAAGVARRHARGGVYGTGVAGAAVAGTAAAIGTAAAVAGAPSYYGAWNSGAGPYGYQGGAHGYYNSWDDYAKQNGIACRPGTTIKLDDGRTYPCQ
jgi:hypothetical protein